ncbi:WAT1-related protein At4g01440-like isoform X2 [Cryptomeria japonica]|uniref:WAT1-related protein At4g01440-like isoform X2 n=1 Tax=Cryptomeria japonica TaxID=3369 RepID=UPI0027DA580B|nr:WAT1-related protein At4g01440-like isoform X2 [Cryptomeria japonica]
MGSSVKGNNNSFDRNDRPPMTCTIFWQIFLIALSGISVSQNLFFIGLAYTSATFTAAIINVLPIVTSVMAIAFRYEKVDIRTKRGQATITGTAICVGGAMIMTLYKGSTISLTGTLVLKLSTWFLGAASLVVCLLFLAAYLTFQVPILKKYPAQKSFIALVLLLATLQSTVMALIFEPHISSWKINWGIDLFSIVYSYEFGLYILCANLHHQRKRTHLSITLQSIICNYSCSLGADDLSCKPSCGKRGRRSSNNCRTLHCSVGKSKR